MADAATTTGSDGPEGETPVQRQARLRREKRTKKMVEQGQDRLARIKAMNGGAAPPDEALGGPSPAAPPSPTAVDDPDEVDISHGFPAGGRDIHAQAQNDPFAAALQQMQQQQTDNPTSDDPVMRMMQQMMGSMGGGMGQQAQDGSKAGGNEQQQLPQLLQAMMNGGGQEQQQAQEAPSSGSSYIWRIVHAVFAFSLAGYISVASTFNGSQIQRHQSVYTEEAGYGFGRRLFMIFTSVELVLQSSRYFLEKGQLRGPGMLAKVANSGFVPEPYANYIRLLGRYISIAQTIFSDVMVLIFVFGFMVWWKGAAA